MDWRNHSSERALSTDKVVPYLSLPHQYMYVTNMALENITKPNTKFTYYNQNNFTGLAVPGGALNVIQLIGDENIRTEVRNLFAQMNP